MRQFNRKIANWRRTTASVGNEQQIITGAIIHRCNGNRASIRKADVRYEQINERDDHSCGRHVP